MGAHYPARSGPRLTKSRAPEVRLLVVAEKNRGALGVIELKDIVKGGMHERFNRLRTIGIRTVMITR